MDGRFISRMADQVYKHIYIRSFVVTPTYYFISVTLRMQSTMFVFYTLLLTVTVVHVSEGTGCNGVAADFVFVMDGSDGVTDLGFAKQKFFVSGLIENFEVSPNSSNVGILAYGSQVGGDTLGLQPFKGKTQIKEHVMSMEYPKGDTNIAVGIDDAREMLKQQGRPTAAKYMVVFTDRLSSSPMHTYTQAFLAKADGIKIFAVGMGPDSSNEEMKMLASGPNSVFTIPDIASLDALGPYMSDQLCKGYMNSYAEMQQHGPGHLTGRRENSTSSQPKFNNMQP